MPYQTQDLSTLTHTYSIVAIDSGNKQIGAAMQTHVFEACNGVIWAQPGVGAIASQSASNPFYAFAGFELLRLGILPAQALTALRQSDPLTELNQVALLDISGNVAAFTGAKCISEAGHLTGSGFSCQANTMRHSTVWLEMATAFEASSGALADRLLMTLEAAERAGGDLRGSQSAAIKVVSTERPAFPWQGFVCDLRVYDHRRPLDELQRLLAIQHAHDQSQAAHSALYKATADEAAIRAALLQFEQAVARIPNADSQAQHRCYFALTLLNKGNVEDALRLLRSAFATDSVWRDVVARITQANPEEAYAHMLPSILTL